MIRACQGRVRAPASRHSCVRRGFRPRSFPRQPARARHQYRVRSTQPIQQRDDRQARQRPTAQVSAVKPRNAPRLTREHHRKQQAGQKKRNRGRKIHAGQPRKIRSRKLRSGDRNVQNDFQNHGHQRSNSPCTAAPRRAGFELASRLLAGRRNTPPAPRPSRQSKLRETRSGRRAPPKTAG